jgi:hypothetical protein
MRHYKRKMRRLGSYDDMLGQMPAQQVFVPQKDNTKTALLWVGGVLLVGVGGYFLLRRLGIAFGNQPRFESDSVPVAQNQTVIVRVLDGLLAANAGTVEITGTSANVTVAEDKKSLTIRGLTQTTGAGTKNLSYSLTDLYGRNPVTRTLKVTLTSL